MHLHNYIIISQNKQDNYKLCTILDYHPPKFVAHIAIRHYRTSQLTPQAQKKIPQADQKLGQYRSGHDWYSKLIKLEHEHRLLKL